MLDSQDGGHVLFFCRLLILLFVWTSQSSPIFAAPILSETVLTANSDGATSGSFDGGGNNLTSTANLATTGQTRNYVAQYFIPSTSGSYEIGLSSSTEDTVIVLYTGDFNPSSPASNATTVQDDFTGTRSPGVTMGTCGTLARYCPQITETLIGGQTYYIVVTSYSPNRTVSDGVNLYIYGEPVAFGTSSQDNAANSLTNTVEYELLNRAQSVINLDKVFSAGAVDRHVAYQQSHKKGATDILPLPSKGEVTKFRFFADDSSSDMESAFQKINEFDDKQRLVIDTAFTYIDSKNGNRSEISDFRFSLESFGYEKSTYGGSLGLQFNRTDTVSPSTGVVENRGASFHFFHLNSTRENFVFEKHLTFGFGRGRAKLVSGDQIWTSKFNTETAAIGFSATGLLSKRTNPSFFRSNQLQIWSTIAVDHAITKASNLRSSYVQGAINEKLDIEIPKTRITNVFIAPKLKFSFSSSDLLPFVDALTVAPGYSCQRVSTGSSSNACGSDFHAYLSREDDGRKFFELQFQNLDNTETLSGMLSFIIPLSFQPASVYKKSLKKHDQKRTKVLNYKQKKGV